MASHLIGISGRKRSGKDTFAERLVTHHGFTRVSFADALKATMIDLDPWVKIEQDEGGVFFGPGEVLTQPYYFRLSEIVGTVGIGWEKAKEIREVRRLLQAHGVGIREHVDPDVWVNAAMVKADEIPGPVVITDVRFPNEVEAVRAFTHWNGDVPGKQVRAKGKIVRVNRPGLPETDLHVSETALDTLVPDFLVRNAGTIEQLHGFADGVARTVLAGD